jgi:S1-C subfamily serine protease
MLSGLLWLVSAGPSSGQLLRAPDLGVWLIRQRGTDGEYVVVVSDLLSDGVFAKAGLREGDQILSIDGKPVQREAQFAQAFLNDHSVTLVLSRNGQRQSLVLHSPTVMEGAVAPEPFYQAGILFDEQKPNDLIVHRVFTCTPAFYAGLRPGDSIVSINGQPISNLPDFSKALRLERDLNLVVNRNGQTKQLTLLTPNPISRLRGTNTATGPGPLPPYNSPSLNPPPAPLLAPPAIPSQMPAIPSPPPIVPALPPPGAVPRE